MSLANLARDVGRKAEAASASSDVVDIITFIESSWGLGMRLFPVQKVILKAHYGIGLDNNPEGFDLTKPIPLDTPHYNDFIDTKARAATNKIEIVELESIPDDAFIELTDHLGTRIRLVNGEHWFIGNDEMETCQSIEDAINNILGGQFTAEAFYGACQIHITSKGFSIEGNEAHLELTKCEGLQVGIPELEIDEYGWETHAHRFYGGMGGFYKNRVAITDWRRENEQVFTEAGYLRYLHEEGRCNIAEVIPGKERREMILSIGRRSGKCVLGDTLVLTDRGVLRMDALGNPEGTEYQPLDIGVAQEGHGKRGRSQFFYNGGVKQTHTLTTHCGYQLGGTGNHRIKVMGEDGHVQWKYLADVREGDQVALHRGTDLWASKYMDTTPFHNNEGGKEFKFPETLDERWGLMLGILAGDGTWTSKSETRLTVEDPEMWEAAKDLFDELFGEHTISIDLRTDNTGSVRCGGMSLRKFLHDLGWSWDCGRYSKTIPWAIMQSPEPVVRSFLRGLFETDGGVEKGGNVVSFSTASERLAREVQTLLLNLGIVSRFKAKWNPKHERDYYAVTVRGLRSRQVFAERVGFMSLRKMEPLWESLKSASKEGGDTESIPHLRPWVRRLLESVPKVKPRPGVKQAWSRSTLREVLGGTIKPSQQNEVTYPRLEEALAVASDLRADAEIISHLHEVFDLDYFYDPVEVVEEGEAPVYDLNIPEGSMFVANGMTNHNTTISACIAAYESYKLIKKGHPQGYFGLPDSNVIQIISVATDKDQAGLLYREVHGHFSNCFAPDTEIITADGIKPIGSLVGTTQTLLAGNGAWVDAPIRSFGKQRLYKLTLSRNGIDKVVHTTADHRWFARDARNQHRGKGFVEFKTTELRPGKHRLQQVHGRSYKNKVNPSPFGVAHGFTYGDGHTFHNERHSNGVSLIGDKDAHLRPYFAMCPEHPRSDGKGFDYSAIPNFFRDLPPIRENKAYLLGWLMGYLAADGTVTKKGQVRLSSSVRANLDFVRDVCAVLGIGVNNIREDTRESNLTGRPFTMYRIDFQRRTLDGSFFILPSHKSAFLDAGGSEVQERHWTVKAVEPTDRVDEVFCASVPNVRSFTLEGNIVTGNCDYFASYLANATQTFATFQTPNDIDRFGTMKENPKARFSIKVTFRSCVAKGLRGAGNIVVILDEVAHFTDKGQSGAKEVYDAVTPSTSAFSKKDPEDTRRPIGPVEGRIILISSPLGRQGQFFRLFQIGMRGGKASMNMLCIEAPTWEVNPTVPASEFEKHYAKDPNVFFTEYGGQFTDRKSGWIEDSKDLIACINSEMRPQKKARPRMPHFLGLDVGLVGDGTAAAIGHLDERGNVIVDLVDQIKAGEGDFEGQDRLEFDDVADWVYALSRKFYLSKGMFDTWAGIPMEQALAKRGLKQMESVFHTKSLKSQIYQNLKDMMFDKRLELYDWPLPEDPGKEHCPYIAELLELQAEMQSKYIIIVEAPQMEGKHDDMSDALARMVWIATNHVGKAVSFGNGGRTVKAGNLAARMASPTQSAVARMKARMGGSHPSRMAGLARGRGGGRGGRR